MPSTPPPPEKMCSSTDLFLRFDSIDSVLEVVLVCSHFSSQVMAVAVKVDETDEKKLLSCFIDLGSTENSSSQIEDTKCPNLLDRTTVYNCYYCDFNSPLKSVLDHHIITTHSLIRTKYQCEKCPFTSNHKSRLTTHMISHSDLRPFPCEHCAYRAKQKNVLKHHVLTKHTLIRPFHCQHCPYQCKAKFLLHIHMRSKHQEGPLMVLECAMCEYTTCYPGNLQLHMRTHRLRSFACNLCDYRTRQNASLRLHMELHSQDRKHPCNYCNYRAISDQNLRSHIKSTHLMMKDSATELV